MNINVANLITERHNQNPQNGISLEDFKIKFGENTLYALQQCADSGDLKMPSKVADKITHGKSQDCHHHIRNILNFIFFEMEKKKVKKTEK